MKQSLAALSILVVVTCAYLWLAYVIGGITWGTLILTH